MRYWMYICIAVVLTACTDRTYTPTVPEALEIGRAYTVFAASTREQRADGNFGFDRSQSIHRLELTVSIPPSRAAGQLDFAYSSPKPETQFTIAGRKEFPGPQAFDARLKAALAQLPPTEREVTVFVHGFNTTQAETAMRAAQLAYDIDLPGILVLYSWPSRGNPLGYAYDIDSMLFARDGLEQLIDELQGLGAKNILMMAHSMGGLLAMETMRQADLRDPGWADRSLRGVVLLSPDIDVEVFRSQMSALSPPPEPFIVMISEKDKILNLSARLRGAGASERLGNLKHVAKVADLPIMVIDATAFSDGAGSSHFVAATSPALIAMVRDARSTAKRFGSEKLVVESLLPSQTVQTQTQAVPVHALVPDSPA